MKFDFVIGNPPYQSDRMGTSNTALPVYHEFIDAAYDIAECVELIHPARFLFNAGRTPKAWNRKMLQDEHLKILEYEPDAGKIFPNTEIKGGVVFSYHDINKNYGAIDTFTIYEELNCILKKIHATNDTFKPLSSLCFVASKFNIQNLFRDYVQYQGHERRMSSNVLNFDCFHDEYSKEDIAVYGIYNNKRTLKYISSEYVDLLDNNLKKYKIVTPKADGNGTFGDILTKPEILPSNTGFTHTFLGIGGFNTENEAKNALKYLKTKLARCLLSVLKITQDLNAEKFKHVPLQDFTSQSDIDWSQSIANIDQQLYKKYNLSDEEIRFIEENVKEME